MKPLVGDDVVVNDAGGYVITEITERRNSLIRPPVSNVGVIFITLAAAEPEPVLLSIDKLTCIAVHCGIRPVITVTKADIAPRTAEQLASVYRKAGISCFCIGTGVWC